MVGFQALGGWIAGEIERDSTFGHICVLFSLKSDPVLSPTELRVGINASKSPHPSDTAAMLGMHAVLPLSLKHRTNSDGSMKYGL